MHILLLDDAPTMLGTIEDFLKGRGHRLRVASDGADALRLMEAEPPDLVISDIQMPGMDGIAFLKAIRERFPDLPVVLMTAYATVNTAVAALHNRAYDYLEKPIQLEELQACLDRVDGRDRPEG